MEVKCSEILADPNFNSRGVISPLDVIDLAKNIEELGLLTPVWVRPIVNSDYKYSLVAGFRRFTAISKVLKQETILIDIKHVDEKTARLLNFVENLQRTDLNILQEAKAIEHLVEVGYTRAEIAREVQKTVPWVEARWALLKLPEEIQKEAAAGFLTQDHIKSLAKMRSREQQFEWTRVIKDKKLKGERSVPIPKRQNIFSKKVRGRHEVNFMREHIYDTLGPSFTTRVCAWVAGEISDFDLYQDLKIEAEKIGKQYTIPTEVREALPDDDDF